MADFAPLVKPETVGSSGWANRLWSLVWSQQFARYFSVGVFNTMFGYSVFASLNFILRRNNIPVSYIFASLISNFVNITEAYVLYKLFVFRTKGNYLNEWLKAMAVYWSGFVPALVLLPLLVRLLNFALPKEITFAHRAIARAELAPYLASAVLMGVGVIYSFIGHTKITFRQKAV